MKKVFASLAMVFACAVFGSAQKTLDADLMKMERGAWDAFAKGDSKFFDSFLSKDAVLVEGSGLMDRAATIKGIAGKPCDVKGYEFGNFKVISLDANTALVTYDATEQGMCGTQALPAKVYASSLYIKRDGKWWAAFHQETPAM